MVKKNNLIIALVIVAILLFGTVASFVGQGFTVITEEVWIPEYTSFSCDARADNMANFDLGDVSRNGEFYKCTSDNPANTYVPDSPRIQCRFYVDASFSYSAWDCPLDASDDDFRSVCDKLEGIVDSQDKTFIISQGRELYVNPLLGSPDITADYPSFGLRVESASGFDFPQTLNCDVSSLSGTEFHSIGAEDLKIVPPGVPLNVVTQKSRVITSQLVSLDDVRGGEVIYVIAPGQYQLVKSADDGFLYVDIEGPVLFDSDIECIPLTAGCSQDAKVVPIQDVDVVEGLGALTGYAVVQGNTDILCRYEIVDGRNVLTSDCISSGAGVECPDNKPLFDYSTGECVSQAPAQERLLDNDLLLFGLIALSAVFLLIIAMLLVQQAQNKRGKKR